MKNGQEIELVLINDEAHIPIIRKKSTMNARMSSHLSHHRSHHFNNSYSFSINEQKKKFPPMVNLLFLEKELEHQLHDKRIYHNNLAALTQKLENSMKTHIS